MPTRPSRVPVVEKRARTVAALPAYRSPGVWRRILARRLRAALGTEVKLVITDNLHTMISYRQDGGRLRLRLHHMFLCAGPEEVDALAGYLEGDPRASARVDRFIETHRYLIRSAPPGERQRRLCIRTRGDHHDLAAIFRRVNERWFDGDLEATITWAVVPRVERPRRSIRLGSYSEDTRTIRVHPALDHPLVPRVFVEYIVFHEGLHAVVGPREERGRRRVHGEAFQRREALFPDLAELRAWERDNIPWLLAWRAGGG